ncbi:flavoprotein [Streptomyces sp. AC536]|uniref:flavoprotein n=1 Tax=Streptomyces buecherae TaxID=2763006 RepID=UPI00164E2F5C|nr:flavoprotein [Streptomyces buecherae]MBC3985778.1 flavoprotein [Streptomyces buecherae]QNJ41092.1 flavoprotein [Streptomyces buecherae]
MRPVLYLIACAAGPTQYIDAGVRAAQAAGWDTCLVLTPSAARWWEARRDELESLTGHPVRSAYKLPGDSDTLPPADAMLVAPLSCTSLNKWAAGIADTLAIGLVSEGVHLGVPVVAMPYFNQAQAAQPAVPRSAQTLRDQGVTLLLGPDGYEPHPPRQGDASAFPWEAAVAALPTVSASRHSAATDREPTPHRSASRPPHP